MLVNLIGDGSASGLYISACMEHIRSKISAHARSDEREVRHCNPKRRTCPLPTCLLLLDQDIRAADDLSGVMERRHEE
jgi:hypothetical protein